MNAIKVSMDYLLFNLPEDEKRKHIGWGGDNRLTGVSGYWES